MRIISNTFIIIFFSFAISFGPKSALAQCSNPITSFPYNEDFENSDGNWTKDIALHWEWGTPSSKPLINAAGSGAKCWIAGGLSASSYAAGTSTLTSPCFNFSSLVNPEISFKIFWETELHYDGATLQYSTDAGMSWSVLGTENSNDACAGTENWFNYSPLNSSGFPGWCGNVQSGNGGGCLYGQGSGQWVTARHNLSFLTGQNKVIFRFFFIAGQTCNGFDGIAIDNIHIGETPPATAADFSYTCGPDKKVEFTNAANSCQIGWSWNFGDAASGADNTSSQQNPAHVFSAAGTYVIKLIVDYPAGVQVSVAPKTISIVDLTTSITDVKCGGQNTGAISTVVTPVGSYTYNWNTSPVQTSPAISNLAGNTTYILTLTSATACPIIAPLFVAEPPVLQINPAIIPAKCQKNNGSISANVTGGSSPYSYTWSTSANTDKIEMLSPGLYGLSVADFNGCSAAVNNLQLENIDNDVRPFLGKDAVICPGQKLLLEPGVFSDYKWQDNSTSSTYTVMKTGDYAVTVADSEGCKGSSSVHIIVDCKGIYFPLAFTPGNDNLNFGFGPLGDIPSLKNYTISIYNRFGEKLFTSKDPYSKWDGTYKGKGLDIQTLVWTASYILGAQKPVNKRGTLLLIH